MPTADRSTTARRRVSTPRRHRPTARSPEAPRREAGGEGEQGDGVGPSVAGRLGVGRGRPRGRLRGEERAPGGGVRRPVGAVRGAVEDRARFGAVAGAGEGERGHLGAHEAVVGVLDVERARPIGPPPVVAAESAASNAGPALSYRANQSGAPVATAMRAARVMVSPRCTTARVRASAVA
jgi:hypothetical protein